VGVGGNERRGNNGWYYVATVAPSSMSVASGSGS